MLRQFLYLNEDLLDQFLSQLEGGLYEEEARTSRASTDKGVGGGLGGPVRAEARRSKGAEESLSRTVRQTPSSKFDRLMSGLAASDGVRLIEDVPDDSAWSDLERSDILEIESRVSLPAVVSLLRAAQGLGSLLPVIQQLSDEPVGDQGVEALSAIQALAEGAGSKVSVIAAVSATPRYRFVAQLEPAGLLSSLDEIEGEATVVAKLRRKLREGEQLATFEFFSGQSALPAEAREEFEKAFGEQEEFARDMFVTAPAALITPIAIFR